MNDESSRTNTAIHDAVRRRYAQAAANVLKGGRATCCGTATSEPPISAPTPLIYDAKEVEGIPIAALEASLGCANPTSLAKLEEGEVVLDLGSGGGIDVLLSAKRVGPSGYVYGLDMTDEMLELAERNLASTALENVSFLKGNIESIPLPDASVDVVISNCVINLSPDKYRVLREAFRVLKPGGRLAIADIVAAEELPERFRQDAEAYASCMAGASTQSEYRSNLENVGFEAIEVHLVRSFAMNSAGGCCGETAKGRSEGPLFQSAFIRASKPHRARVAP